MFLGNVSQQGNYGVLATSSLIEVLSFLEMGLEIILGKRDSFSLGPDINVKGAVQPFQYMGWVISNGLFGQSNQKFQKFPIQRSDSNR